MVYEETLFGALKEIKITFKEFKRLFNEDKIAIYNKLEWEDDFIRAVLLDNKSLKKRFEIFDWVITEQNKRKLKKGYIV